MKTLKDIHLKRQEIKAIRELKQKLLKKFPDIEVILYGSKARGDSKESSDIDILILIDQKIDRNLKEKITQIKYDIELKYDVIFSTIIENKKVWKSPLFNVMPLHLNVHKDGVSI